MNTKYLSANPHGSTPVAESAYGGGDKGAAGTLTSQGELSNGVSSQRSNLESAPSTQSSGTQSSGTQSSSSHSARSSHPAGSQSSGIQSAGYSGQAAQRSSVPTAADSFHGMAGRSPAMRRFFNQVQTVAPRLRVATLEGEDGTGKTLTARTLHMLGPSAKEPFVPCLATIFLSEQHAGLTLPWCPDLIGQARGGTLFLDRVDELDGPQQARLFEFLVWFDDQHERPTAASDTPRQVIVSSTSSLRRMVAADALRGDLCSRLTAIRLLLPPLRERREDIPLLAQFFAQRFSQNFRKQIRGLAPEALAPLLRHPWPGNVRELESVITSAALQTESQWIRSIDLPLLTSPSGAEAHPAESDFNLDRVIARHIERTLERTRGNKLRAASILGISRSTLYRILASS